MELMRLNLYENQVSTSDYKNTCVLLNNNSTTIERSSLKVFKK